MHEEIAAEVYVHEEPLETHAIAAEVYTHTDIAAEPYEHEDPQESHSIASEPYTHVEVVAEPYEAEQVLKNWSVKQRIFSPETVHQTQNILKTLFLENILLFVS